MSELSADWHGVVPDILATLREAASDADENAALACRRSKYAVQDYYLCLEAWTQRLHNTIAAKYGLSERCGRGAFQSKMDALRASLKTPHDGGRDD